MYLRTLVAFFVVVAGCIRMTHAAEVPLQDTVKKVYIKVIASEKPKAVSIDSVQYKNRTSPPVTTKNSSVRHSAPAIRRSTETALKPTSQPETADRIFPARRSKAQVEHSSVKPDEHSTTLIIKKIPKPTSSSTNTNTATTDKPTVSEPKENTHEEIDQAQTVDDSVIGDGSNVKTSKTYLWVGIVLVVVGIILGILFGKTALLISIAGMVFVIIGYAIKS